MNERINAADLWEELRTWNGYLKRKVRLVACGGTAMTLLGVKASTKDVDFMVPQHKEHDYLIKTLQQLGYRPERGFGWKQEGSFFIFDLFRGNMIHTTQLLESPLLEGNSFLIREFDRIEVRALNNYDLIVSKLMRGSSVDYEDCLMLYEKKENEIDLDQLKARYDETISYDISENRIRGHLDFFLEKIKGLKKS